MQHGKWMRIVLDTSVLVAAVRSRHGASNFLLQKAAQGGVQLLAAPALFLEYEEVLNREEHSRIHGMSPQVLERFLSGLAAIIEPVRVYYQWRPQMQDADDEMVLETALNGQADWIVTHNKRDFSVAVSRFQLQLASPAELVRRLEQ